MGNCIDVNIRTINGIVKVKGYKTRYKNIVVTKTEIGYSITHYPSGTKIHHNNYRSKKKVFDDLENVLEQYRDMVNEKVNSFDSKRKKELRINF